MSYQVGSVCYSTAEAAGDALAASVSGSVVSKGSAVYRIDAYRDGANIVYDGAELGGLGSFTSAYPYSLQPCGLLDWPDAVDLSWQVAGVWIAALVVVMMRRGA